MRWYNYDHLDNLRRDSLSSYQQQSSDFAKAQFLNLSDLGKWKWVGRRLQAVKSAMLMLNDCVNPKQVSPEPAYANFVQLDDMPGCVGAAAVLFVVGTTPTGP